MKNIQLLWKFMKGNKMMYFASMISMGLATFFSIISPLVIRTTIDSIIGNHPLEVPQWVIRGIESIGGREYLYQNLWICALILVAITIANGIFLYTKGKWSAQAAEDIAKKMKEKLYDHIQRQPYDWHVKVDTGDLIQRCTSDVETIRRFLAVQFVEISRVIFMLVFSLSIMLVLDVKMTLISMAVVPLLLIFSWVFYNKVRKSFQLVDESEARLSTVLQENLAGVRIVRAFGRQAFEQEKFRERNKEFKDLVYYLVVLLAWYWSLSDLLSLMQMGAVLVAGTYLAGTGAITLGTLVVFTTYEGMLLWPIRQLGRILADMGKTMVSLGRIREVLDEPEEDMNAQGLTPAIQGEIQFNNVSFSYDGQQPILKNISFTIEAGKTIAVIGPTGSGKSSLVHLLQGLYDYDGGSITIDGIELRDMNKQHLRKNIGIVLQEPFLYSKTLGENIGLAKRRAKPEEIYEAANVASIHDVIETFENGYDTPVGERGVTLSGGQKQRIAIARTIIQKAPILIFDDSLSAIDTETDAAIRKGLREKSEKVTTIIISHRITTIAEADVIMALDQGQLVQWGTHEQLIKEDGLYRRIWNIQNQLEQDLGRELQEGRA